MHPNIYIWKKVRQPHNFSAAKVANKKVGYVLSNDLGEELVFGFDPQKQLFFLDRTKAGKHDFSEKFASHLSFAPRFGQGDTIKGSVILDKTSLELFWDNGLTVMTEIFFPTEPFNKITPLQ